LLVRSKALQRFEEFFNFHETPAFLPITSGIVAPNPVKHNIPFQSDGGRQSLKEGGWLSWTCGKLMFSQTAI
jgi:hypothetical protein